MKDKRMKKKIGKRNKEEENLQSDNEEMKIESTEILNNFPIKEQSNDLDFFGGQYSIEGIKGHSNFYSNQVITSGTFYFEITIKNLEFKIYDFINAKKLDEFSKKYYDNIISNPKSYNPNIRVGLSLSSKDLEIPVGSDQDSYCYRIRDGALITEGQILGYNEICNTEDVIGVLIKLKPPMPEFMIKSKNLTEIVDNEGNQNVKNTECFIKYFVNGVEQKEGFIGLKEGDYNIVVTLYNFSKAEVDFGNKLKFFDKLPPGINATPVKDI